MFSDPKYSFSVCQKKFFLIQSKVNIFHQIQPKYNVPTPHLFSSPSYLEIWLPPLCASYPNLRCVRLSASCWGR